MQYPSRFEALLGYPFPRLRALLGDVQAGGVPLRLSLGEPKHPFPNWAVDALIANQTLFNNYPKNNGEEALTSAIIGYLSRRYAIENIDDANITPLNGTREGLYMAALALFPETKNGKPAKVLVPNPFYQVYMIGAKTLGLDVVFMNTSAETGFLPDLDAIDEDTFNACSAFFICSPSNPQGAIASDDYHRKLVHLAEKHDFLIMSDECYGEIYFGDAPNSAFKIAQEEGADLNRVIAFHSLSKRSNMPGLRSGFAVSGKESMRRFQELRGYAGAPVPGPVQMASAKLWDDDAHVVENRAAYQQKMDIAAEIFGTNVVPAGGFFLWLPIKNDEEFAKALYQETGIEVLPGSYLGAETPSGNPASDYVRVALVAEQELCAQALKDIQKFHEKHIGKTLWL